MAVDPSTPLPRSRLATLSQQLPLICTVLVCAVLYTIGCLSYRGFFSGYTFSEFFGGNAVLGLASIGMTFVILAGGIDLSVGSMVGFTSILTGLLVEQHHWNPIVAVAIALAIGCAFGLVSGAIIHFFDLAPFLVTLAGMFILRGLALTIAPPAGRVTIENEMLIWPGLHPFHIGGTNVRLVGIFFLAVTVLAGLLLRYTRFGRNVYALGGNEQSALLMGLPVGRTKILIYGVSALCSAIGGILVCMNNGAGEPTAGAGLELDAIAAVVIGGTLLTGGIGSVLGTLLGVLILAIIQTGLMFNGQLISWWLEIVTGGLLLIFITLQKLLTKATSRA